MKRTVWLISSLPLVITAVALQFMPDTVPLHYNAAGEIDRWGSKYESLLFPAIALAMALVWQFAIPYFEKKALSAPSDKERAQALQNVKVAKICGVSTAVLFTVLQVIIILNACRAAKAGAGDFDSAGRIICIACGVFFIVLANFMPKAKNNRLIGVRTSWSMYNDATWMKSNRAGAAAFMAAGLFTVVTAIFIGTPAATILMMVWLFIAAAFSALYSRKVYKQEIAKEKE